MFHAQLCFSSRTAVVESHSSLRCPFSTGMGAQLRSVRERRTGAPCSEERLCGNLCGGAPEIPVATPFTHSLALQREQQCAVKWIQHGDAAVCFSPWQPDSEDYCFCLFLPLSTPGILMLWEIKCKTGTSECTMPFISDYHLDQAQAAALDGETHAALLLYRTVS